ncbi:hypothetical protein L1887_18314 [Cichorium endivia]|nr:hypothetical protein L1887_18314 [Cichorium endivia]
MKSRLETNGPVLIGEAYNLDHLSTFHEYMDVGLKIKYLGGLTLALDFGNSIKAKQFLSDINRWKNWFKTLQDGDVGEIQYERIACLKIVGLPITLWDEENFSRIASKYGRVVNPFNFIYNRADWSMGKVGVLTSRRSWINEEVSVMANGRIFHVGVVEYTDDWSPFRPCPFDKTVDSDDDVDEDDSEGVSDTWMNVEEDESEDGEIRPERHEEPPESEVKVGNGETVVREDGDPIIGDGDGNQKEDEKTPNGDTCPEEVGIERVDIEVTPPCQSKENCTPVNRRKVGDLENWVSMGCFGPFPSTTNWANVIQSASSESKGKRNRKRRTKRRRADFDGNCCSPSSTPDSNKDPQPQHSKIDLHSEPRVGPIEVSESVKTVNSTHEEEDEISATLQIGAELGFKFEEDGKTTKQMLGEIGVRINEP